MRRVRKMKTRNIVKQIEKLPNGRFFRIRYLSNLPVKAEYAKQGIAVIEIVETTVRTGVAYKNIKTTSKSTTRNKIENAWSWVIPNKIRYNKNTSKNYLVVAPIKEGSNTKRSFILSMKNSNSFVTEAEICSYINNSYWKKQKPVIQNITIDNILTIN